MAKVYARGRFVLAEARRFVADPEPIGDMVGWERRVRLMSDRRELRQSRLVFSHGRRDRSATWKLGPRIRAEAVPDGWIEAYKRAGWEVTRIA
jgi:hypothetical protein